MTLKEQMEKRLMELGRDPKRSLGQNFLIGEHVVNAIVTEVERLTPTLVIEIGPGLGALTDRLRERHMQKFLIELDAKMVAYWRAQDEKVLEGDALQIDWREGLLPQMGVASGDGILLLSNLPYQISARLVVELSTSAPWLPRMVLMFQREVAERLRATPRSEDYGFLSVVAQTHWHMERVVDASPEDFYPQPNVMSRVLGFLRRPTSSEWGDDFTSFVKLAFSQRRKFMAKAFPENKQTVIAGLKTLGFTEKTRAEELSPQDFQNLFRHVKAHGVAE
jgi:16S rRNA (adenine1518-N6/adenine1519-N6)-dimethyltransferase